MAETAKAAVIAAGTYGRTSNGRWLNRNSPSQTEDRQDRQPATSLSPRLDCLRRFSLPAPSPPHSHLTCPCFSPSLRNAPVAANSVNVVAVAVAVAAAVTPATVVTPAPAAASYSAQPASSTLTIIASSASGPSSPPQPLSPWTIIIVSTPARHRPHHTQCSPVYSKQAAPLWIQSSPYTTIYPNQYP